VKKFVSVLETTYNLSETISTDTAAIVVWFLIKITQVTASFYLSSVLNTYFGCDW